MANFKITSRKRRRTTTGSPQAFHLAKFLETMSKLPGSKSPPDRHDDRDLSLALSRALSLEPARGTLENMFAPVRDTLIQHEKAFYDLRVENHNLLQELDELKQYTRRNALRVYNPNWKESTSEDTDKRIIDLAREFGVPIENFEISRSHRVGRQVPGKTRPILVKFIGYRPRERLFNIRKDIKAKYPTVDIFEDLTAVTAQLSYKARQLRRAGEIYQTWVRDGKIFVVLNHGGRAHLVHDEDALHDLVPQPQSEGAYGMTYHTQTPQTRPPSRSRSFIEGNTQQLRPQSSVGEQGQAAMTSSSAFAEPTNMPQSPLTALSGIACHESGGPPRSSPNPASNRSRGPSSKFSQHSEALQSRTAASESSPARSSPRAAGRRQALSLASQFKKLPRSPHMSTPPPCSPTSSKNGSAGLQKSTQYTKTLSMSSPHLIDRHSNPSIPEITLEPPTPSRVTGELEDEATPGPTDDPLNELNDRDLNSSSSDSDITIDDPEEGLDD